MSKLIKYTGIITLLMIVLTSGIYVGIKLNQYNVKQIEGNQSNAVKVAIVNLDEGTQYQGVNRNFANEILESASEDFVMTGLEDAKAGLVDARYAAYIIIPSNFSQNISTINTIPEKSILKYEISGNLSEGTNDKALLNVMKLKEQLNDDVGFMYISSILGEFHEGQMNSLKVLSNDTRDKEVLMAISNYDLVATLDLKEIERLENKIEDLDINPDTEVNEKIIASIDRAYKSYLNETSSQLNDLKTNSLQLNEDNQTVSNAGQAIENLLNDDGTYNYDTQQTGSLLQAYNENLAKSLSQVITEINKKAETQNESNKNYIQEKKDNLDGLLNDLQSSNETLDSNQFKKLEEDTVNIFDNFLKTQKFQWKDYFNLSEFLNNEVKQEAVENAIQYIDKLIITELSKINYNIRLLDYESIVNNIAIATENDEKLKTSLKIYAESIGKTDEFIPYTLLNYLDDNKDVLATLPEINSHNKTDMLIQDIEMSLVQDVDILSKLQNESLKNEVIYNIKNQENTNIKDENDEKISNYKTSIDDLKNIKVDDLQETVEKVSYINPEDVFVKVHDDLESLSIKQGKNKVNLLEVIQKHNMKNALFQDDFSRYNPLDFIQEKEIASYVKDYNSNNKTLKFKIEGKNHEYTTFVADSYDNSNEQVRSMKEDIKNYQMQSDEKVTKGLENAKNIKNNTAADNNTLMSNYINKLPYTRIGTVENTVVYDFITSPTNMDGVKISNSTSNVSVNFFIIILGVCVILLILLLVAIVCHKLHSKNRDYM